MSKSDDDQMAAIFKRMGEPSWWILSALDPTTPLPGIEIIRQVEDLLRRADYPHTRLDPSTLHYALQRMIDDGLVRHEGKRIVEIARASGTPAKRSRDVYTITGLGMRALARRQSLSQVLWSAGNSLLPKENPV